MSDIKITYAEVERPIVGIELNGRVGKRSNNIRMCFNIGNKHTDGGLSICKEKYQNEKDEHIFYIGIGDYQYDDSCISLTLPQMEALEKAIHSMVASIKGE